MSWWKVLRKVSRMTLRMKDKWEGGLAIQGRKGITLVVGQLSSVNLFSKKRLQRKSIGGYMYVNSYFGLISTWY